MTIILPICVADRCRTRWRGGNKKTSLLCIDRLDCKYNTWRIFCRLHDFRLSGAVIFARKDIICEGTASLNCIIHLYTHWCYTPAVDSILRRVITDSAGSEAKLVHTESRSKPVSYISHSCVKGLWVNTLFCFQQRLLTHTVYWFYVYSCFMLGCWWEIIFFPKQISHKIQQFFPYHVTNVLMSLKLCCCDALYRLVAWVRFKNINSDNTSESHCADYSCWIIISSKPSTSSGVTHSYESLNILRIRFPLVAKSLTSLSACLA